MTCGTCPDAVTQVLRKRVRAATDKLAALLDATNFFNDAFGAVAGVAVAAVDAAVDSIPTPVSFDFLDILGYVTCPLTPLALGLGGIDELTDLDPSVQAQKIKGLGSGDIARARRNYEAVLNNSPHAKLIKQARRYEQKLRRLDFTASVFAEALLIAATVQTVCDQGEFEEGGFQAFAQLADGFSFTGGVPATLDPNLAALLQRLAQGEAKFKALREGLV